jgi:hypothetical protein
MSNDDLQRQKDLTFEQAEGIEALPRQLLPKEVSPELRAKLWQVIYLFLSSAHFSMAGESSLLAPWEGIFYAMHVHRDHRMADEFTNDFSRLVRKAKTVIENGDYAAVFGWIQWVLRRADKPLGFTEAIESALVAGRSAYHVFDGDTIAPVGSDAERETLERAFADLAATEFNGARAHLRKAAEELTAGRYADSVRESVHAVEASARVLEPSAALNSALARLENSAKIHKALKHGFANLYGYTSDEKGIRHPLLDDGTANVDETDALFMIGACAAFVSYLINKARTAGLL